GPGGIAQHRRPLHLPVREPQHARAPVHRCGAARRRSVRLRRPVATRPPRRAPHPPGHRRQRDGSRTGPDQHHHAGHRDLRTGRRRSAMTDATGAATIGPDGVVRCPWALGSPMMTAYHDDEWGRPVHGASALFERVALEGFQAGLSWATILAKRVAFRDAFADFDPDAVAAFTDADLEALMGRADIVRNRAKIVATRTNARATIALRDRGGLD